MKQIFKTLGVIVGFFGLASLVIFWAMSPGRGSGFAPVSLTADIAANVPNGNAPVPAPDIKTGVMGILGTTTPIPTPTPPAITPTETSAPVLIQAQTPNPTPTPASTSAPNETPLAPFVSFSQTNVPSSTTTTVTVSQTAPPPPQSSGPVAPKTSGADITLPFTESNFANDMNWQTTWGTLGVTSEDYLELSAGPGSVGGGAYLAHAASWTNYSMNAVVNLAGGHVFGLIADYMDASNYVICKYSANAAGASATGTSAITMELDQFVGGYETALAPAVSIPLGSDGNDNNANSNGIDQDLNVSIRVNGQYGSCSLDGQIISNEGIGAGKVAMKSVGSGSIGFMINDPNPNTSRIVIKSVSVAAD